MISIFLLIVAAFNWTVAGQMACWKKPLPPAPQPATTVYWQCFEGIKDLAKMGKAYAPILFSRKEGAGFKVPDRWVTGTCYIHIDMDNDDDEDYITFHDIAVEAGILAAACVARPPHLGGTIAVGPKRVMNVTIFGVRRAGDNVLAFDGEYDNLPASSGSAELLRRDMGHQELPMDPTVRA
ncbi:MAG: hypothetical protein Q9178_002062 [Gyalolechia marmorata]